MAALSEGRQPVIHGDGEQTRDFTYVSDVADGVLAAATAPGVAGMTMNLARGGCISLNRLFEILREIIGISVDPVYGPPRAGDVRDSQADSALAKKHLGFAPKVSIEEGLRRTVEWWRASRELT